jgi:hypothetical protein
MTVAKSFRVEFDISTVGIQQLGFLVGATAAAWAVVGPLCDWMVEITKAESKRRVDAFGGRSQKKQSLFLPELSLDQIEHASGVLQRWAVTWDARNAKALGGATSDAVYREELHVASNFCCAILDALKKQRAVLLNLPAARPLN